MTASARAHWPSLPHLEAAPRAAGSVQYKASATILRGAFYTASRNELEADEMARRARRAIIMYSKEAVGHQAEMLARAITGPSGVIDVPPKRIETPLTVQMFATVATPILLAIIGWFATAQLSDIKTNIQELTKTVADIRVEAAKTNTKLDALTERSGLLRPDPKP